MWYEAFNSAKEAYIKAIERLQLIAPIHLIQNNSNHDFMSGWFLSQTVNAFFHNNPNLTWDITMRHRKYFYTDKH